MSSSSDQHVPRSTPAREVLAFVIVVVLALLLILVPNAGFQRFLSGDVEAGTRVPATSVSTAGPPDDPSPRPRFLQAPMPGGVVTLEVNVGTTALLGADEREVEDGGRFVEVSWTPRRIGTTAAFTTIAGARPEPRTTLSLLVEGRRYQLVDRLDASDGPAKAIIAVAGSGTPRVVATSAGTDRAARPVADPSPEPDRECSQESEKEHLVAVGGCRLSTQRHDYVPGLGWAPPGRDWLVVDDVALPSRRDGLVVGWSDRKYLTDWDEWYGYRASGPVAFTMTVDGTNGPHRSVGEPVVTGDRPRVPPRAYLVPSGRRTTVRVTYQWPVTLAPGQHAPRRVPRSGTASDTWSLEVPGRLDSSTV